MNETIEKTEAHDEARQNLDMFFDAMIKNKMKIGDRMGFEYKNRHYTFIRDE